MTDSGTDARLHLPDDVTTWVAGGDRGEVVDADRIPGGATRRRGTSTCAIDGRSGGPCHCATAPSRMPRPERLPPLPVEAEMIIALHAPAITVPYVRAVHPDARGDPVRAGPRRHVVLPDQGSRRAGPRGPRLHRATSPPPPPRPAPARPPELRSGEVRPRARPRTDRGIRRRGTAPDGSMEPLLQLSVDWLERNVPDYDGPVVSCRATPGPATSCTRTAR